MADQRRHGQRSHSVRGTTFRQVLPALNPCDQRHRLLKPQEDEVAQHYAVKTIENICSQGGDWAARFCSEDLVFNLVQARGGGPRQCRRGSNGSSSCLLQRSRQPTNPDLPLDRSTTRPRRRT